MKTLERTYEPRGSAKSVFSVRAPEVLLSGPAGTGKSRACLEKLHHVCLLTPNVRALIVRKTFTSLKSTALVTYENHVANISLSEGHVVKRVEAPQYRYANGSSITLGGMDNATRIMSSEYDIIYVQEAIELTENDWEALTTRLRNGAISFQQLLADTNPSHPTHWLKQRCERGQTVMLESRHEENPVYFSDTGVPTAAGDNYMSKLDNLTGVRYQRLRRGNWVGAEGQIYDEWDPAVHVIDEMPKGWESWTRYWSVDFGFTNPFVCTFWAEDPDGRLYLYRELYRTKRIVDDHAKDILAHVVKGGRWVEPKPAYIICDHDAEDRATLQKSLGLPNTPAKKDVTVGIEAVQRRLRKAEDGRPRLFVLRNARVDRDPLLVEAKKPTSTEEEFPGYVWDIKEGKVPKEAPVKENDHGMDTVRYMVAHRDLQPEYKVRWL